MCATQGIRAGHRGLVFVWMATLFACDSTDSSVPSMDVVADAAVTSMDAEADAVAPTMDAEADAVAPTMDAADLPERDGAAPTDEDGSIDDARVDATADVASADMSNGPVSCEDACQRVAGCLVDVCDGFGPGARGQIHDRCIERCTPELAEEYSAASCEEIAESIGADLPVVEAACAQVVDGEGDGLNALYIGHSFGRPFASRMAEWTSSAGVQNHRQRIVMRGGANGAPLALWNDDDARTEIQGILEGGDVELLTLICCSTTFLMDGTDPGIRRWMDFALAQNPDTRFALAMPWPDFPAMYPSAEAYADLWNPGHDLWHALIDQLRADYPGVEIDCIPHGRAALELRALFEAGELGDVDAMTSGDGDAIFSDAKGHADQIMLDLGTLVWVGATYGVDLTGYPLDTPYEADLVGIAQTIIAEDDHTR